MQGFLDLRRLRYFKAIADHGSISGAARSLNLAQPALTHHVNQLEMHLGTTLLLRRHDGVSLTDAGQLLLRHAVEIDSRVRRAETELSGLTRKGNQKTKIRLAVISSLAADLTPILLASLSREVPEIVLRITESGTLDSRELLEAGKADLAIYLAGVPNETPLSLERLYLVSADKAGRTADPIPFAQAIEEPLILPARHNPLREMLETAAAALDRPLNVVLEVDGPGPRKNAILAGHGSTIFGAHYIANDERNIGLVAQPIIEPTMFRPLYLGARTGLDPALVDRIRSVLAKEMATFAGMQAEEPGH